MWHDPQNCSFPELEESVSILSKVHPLQPEEKKVRQKTSTVAQMTAQQSEHHSIPSGFQRGVASHYWTTSSRAQNPAGASCRASCTPPVGLAAERATEQMGQASRAPPACYLAGYLWVATRGLSFGRLSGLLPTAHPEFGVKDSWNYKVLTLLSMSTLITAGLEDLQIQKKLEHVAYPERRARWSAIPSRLGWAQCCSETIPALQGKQGPREPPPAQPSLPPSSCNFVPVAENSSAAALSRTLRWSSQHRHSPQQCYP